MTEIYGPDLTDISELRTVRDERLANQLLSDGWVLLGLFDRRDDQGQHVEYHLGYPATPAGPILG